MFPRSVSHLKAKGLGSNYYQPEEILSTRPRPTSFRPLNRVQETEARFGAAITKDKRPTAESQDVAGFPILMMQEEIIMTRSTCLLKMTNEHDQSTLPGGAWQAITA